MALMFARLARNFIKAGYFPTDEATLAGVLQAMDSDAIGAPVRILDPCCGEGIALAELKHHLGSSGIAVQALGVEYDRERAWHAKGLLDSCIHADVNDVFVSPRSAGLLWLNPPYGNAVRDQAGTGERGRASRIETSFVRRTVGWLAFGGVLVLIVPHYAFDRELANLIARNFDAVRVFTTPEPRFKQVVLFGIKRRSDTADPEVAARLEAVAQADYGSAAMPPVLPEVWAGEPYWIPAAPAAEFRFQSVSIDAAQLGAELGRLQAHTLWPQFRLIFQGAGRTRRRPLRDLSQWHLALALAAGQIAGVVRARSGRTLLIKGDTFKEKELSVERQERSDGGVSEVRILTDRFVPVIRGIDFTPGPQFGTVVTIR